MVDTQQAKRERMTELLEEAHDLAEEIKTKKHKLDLLQKELAQFQPLYQVQVHEDDDTHTKIAVFFTAEEAHNFITAFKAVFKKHFPFKPNPPIYTCERGMCGGGVVEAHQSDFLATYAEQAVKQYVTNLL
jgi:hypothetical protein